MKHWQKERNYRKHENEDGTLTHIITVDDQEVEVSAEVFEAYSQADRRERYQAERDDGRLLSLERLAEDEMQLSHLTDKHIESAEDLAIQEMMIKQLLNAANLLSSEEQTLIRALFIENMSEREYAQVIGLSQKGVNKRKHKALQKVYEFWYSTPPVFRDGQ
ncbi:sigma factor-like helix-turn-helix DNA-binding protein [Christensenella minuta]|uniref:sigma factor-like helix-turn-helix DNA-binding protein n=1 Tax=Christensenella minuta TaxID=626937 RepID=UPI002157A97C|nr:sigma factor-like helix-turn-helix DNA-binding protein [Christensenella minuta]